ncbi:MULTISPECIES: hypothetical protein [Listeria]|uniref:hypothetical protein n=1 Tax=Listeria TaxID=1637 RepID=UPI000B5940DD|nr:MULTISPECIES: hypothetical protein [Listeria]
MKVRCSCSNLMHDEDSSTCTTYGICPDEKYYELLEKDLKTVEEFVDGLVFSTPVWECKVCGRLYFFKPGRIDVYKLEKEILDGE